MSYARIDAKRVQEACENYLLRQKQWIEDEQEPLIKAEMERWFFRAKTRDVAIKRLSADIWNLYNKIRFRGSYWNGDVERLLTLAKESGDGFVSVDSELANILF